MIELSDNLVELEHAFDLLRLHQHHPERYPQLLESVVQGPAHARYDILFAFPGETLIATDRGGFLDALDRRWRASQQLMDYPIKLPFHGGWFLYLGYELAVEIEPRLNFAEQNTALPIAFATRFPAAVICDHNTERVYIVSEEGSSDRLQQIIDDIATLPEINASQDTAAPVITEINEEPPQRFIDGVLRIRDYIREGDVFQVNLSRRWQIDLSAANAAQLYRRLRQHNPAPFAALVKYGDKSIISSSPERLVAVSDKKISARPIAGTRPRGHDKSSDQAYSDTLMAHPKERAEHVMLIDLERNDLGRVCRPGSVVVDELMVLESYAHVHHIVSNVCGILRDDVSPAAVIRAVFPGGTITGCPKVRCMEIIYELEQAARGPYTGAVGYLDHNGNMDLNILIRTMLLDGHQLSFRTGAGIVADSVPESELQETRAKARGLLRALGIDDVSA